MASMRLCTWREEGPDGRASRCPTPVPAGTRHCPRHARAHEVRRGTRQQRGYDARHTRTSRAWKARVAAGEHVTCWRCDGQILDADDLHLGHADGDRTITRGPEHALCNLRAAGRAAHA